MSDPREIIDPRFKDLTLTHVTLDRISTGHKWTEGPVWFGDQQRLFFSDIPNNKIFYWCPHAGVNLYREHSNYANGNTRDLQGRLITCEHGSRSVTRTEYGGEITTLRSHFQKGRLNSPNDVVVKSDGTIWFSDPDYGILSDYEGNRADPELSSCSVYRLDHEKDNMDSVVTELSKPNGLAFSVDEKCLYIADSGSSHDDAVPSVVRVFDVAENNAVSNGRDFAIIESGSPDGLRVDIHDNVWISAADGVHCFSSDGTILGKIKVPETVSNLSFGGPRGNQLFITASRSVYSLFVNTRSAKP